MSNRRSEPEKVQFVPFQNGLGVFLTEWRDGKAVRTHGPLKDNQPFQIDEPEQPVTEVVRERKYVTSRLKKVSAKQERRIASDVGGRAQPASGALPGAKSDVRKVGRLRVEAKFTYAKAYRLTMDVIDKIVGEAQGDELPGVVVDFMDKSSGRVLRTVVVVPYEDWLKEVQDAPADNSGSSRG